MTSRRFRSLESVSRGFASFPTRPLLSRSLSFLPLVCHLYRQHGWLSTFTFYVFPRLYLYNMGSLVLLLRLLPYCRMLRVFAPTTRPILLATPGLSSLALATPRHVLLPLHPVSAWRLTGATNRFMGRSALGSLLWLLIDIFFGGSPSLHELIQLLMTNFHPSMVLLAPFVGLML
ncbi:hypothetical protein IWX49DRAFT_192665 [Phyllosticta citricarpa]